MQRFMLALLLNLLLSFCSKLFITTNRNLTLKYCLQCRFVQGENAKRMLERYVLGSIITYFVELSRCV